MSFGIFRRALLVLVALTALASVAAIPALAADPPPSTTTTTTTTAPSGGVEGQAGIPYAKGDVFVGDGQGTVPQFSPSGTLIQTLDNTSGSNEQTGMCFDASGNLYTTNFSANSMSKFDNAGNLLVASWGGPFNADAESCVVDSAGNVYVGQADGDAKILKFDLAGTLLDSFTVTTGDRGTDWIDLASDQCTIFYTSEGDTVFRYNACTRTQLANFATGMPEPCYAIRIRQNGEVLVACGQAVVRLDSSGNNIGSTTAASLGLTGLFAMNLDPDGTSFWTAGFSQDKVVKADIVTGAVITSFTFTGVGSSNAGLTVFGEPLASTPAPAPAPPPVIQPTFTG